MTASEHRTMILRQEVKVQTVFELPVDKMTVSLASDETKPVVLQDTHRGIVLFDSPSIDRLEPEFTKGLLEDGRYCPRRESLTGAALVTQDIPQRRGPEIRADIAQADQTRRLSSVPARIDTKGMEVAPLHHDSQRGFGQNLHAGTKIQPLVVLFRGEPDSDCVKVGYCDGAKSRF
jgi:hypothetical protein